MTPFDVADLLRRTILMVTPVTIVNFLWANAPRAATNYAVLSMNTMSVHGYGETVDTNAMDGDLDRRLDTLYDIAVGVEFHRPDAALAASLLSRGLIRQDVTELWNSEGVGLVGRSDIRDITKLITSMYEDRAQIEVTMQALITAPDEKIFGVNATRIVGEIHNVSEKIADVDIGPP